MNEAYLRLAEMGRVDVKDRAHFFALSARLMRRILVDLFRAKRNQKRTVPRVRGVRERGAWPRSVLLPIGGVPRPLVVTRFNERGATIAPSGRVFAFVSDASGTSEVYVRAVSRPR